MRGRLAVVAAVVVVAVTLVASPAGADAGDLDPTFGSGGIAHVSVVDQTDTAGAATAVQPDGKVVIAANSGGKFAVLRMNADGSPDASFGTGGVVTTSFGVPESGSYASGLAIQPDGKIVVVGTTWSGTFATALYASYFSVARYLTDGRLDSGFGTRGTVLTTFPDNSYPVANAVALRPDGRVVVAGGVSRGGFTSALALAQYTPDGLLDATFGTAGEVIDEGVWGAGRVALRGDGRIVVAGSRIGDGGMLARFEPDGTRDATFGDAGIVTTGGQSIFALALDASENIVTGGSAFDGPGFVVRRFVENGSPDTSFGTAGSTATSFGCINQEIARDVAIEPDGTIVLGGAACGDAFGLVRYRPDGTVDPRFGQDGLVSTDAHQVDGADAVAAAGDGRIVAVGYYDHVFTAVRYLAA